MNLPGLNLIEFFFWGLKMFVKKPNQTKKPTTKTLMDLALSEGGCCL
jgi:hypothetical protein